MSPANPRRRTAPATASSSSAGACTRPRTSLLGRAECWPPSSSKKASRPARRRSRARRSGHARLFRRNSGRAHHFRVLFDLGLDEQPEFGGRAADGLQAEGRDPLPHLGVAKGNQHLALQLRDDFPRDRKSTRLNSSHSQISYAVFCLKKKKKLTRVGLRM